MLAGLTFVVAISLASSEEITSKQILEPNPVFSEENDETAFEGINGGVLAGMKYFYSVHSTVIPPNSRILGVRK